MVVWRRLAFVALLAFSFAPVLFHDRSGVENEDSAAYQGLADSLRHGRYEFNYEPQVVYPPGFPLTLALWGAVFAPKHASYLVLVALLGFAGLIAALRAQRMDSGQTVALTTCLLLACSPMYFSFVSQNVMSETLYLLLSSLAILCARRLDSAKSAWPYALAIAVLTPGVVLVRAVGASWVAGLLLWLVLSAWFDRPAAARRARLVGPALVAGVMALLGWSAWSFSHQPPPDFEGQARTYLAVAVYRDPHDTDLGKLGWAELPVRWLDQAATDAASALALLLRPPWISPAFYSVPIAAFFFLCGLGLAAFVRQRGIQAIDCYLICYWLILAAWPFDGSSRYVMPVLPFCAAYAWRGIREFTRQASADAAARLLGPFAVVVAAGGIFSLLLGHTLPGKQNLMSVVFWTSCAASCWIWRSRGRFITIPAMPVRALSAAIATGLVITGIVQGMTIVRANTAQSEGSVSNKGLDLAARQIRASSTPSEVVMADWCYMIHRWSERRCVRFPATHDVGLILEALRNNRISWLVVRVEPQRFYYFQPPEWERLQRIEEAAPGLLRLAQEEAGYRVYQVEGAELVRIPTRLSGPAAQPSLH